MSKAVRLAIMLALATVMMGIVAVPALANEVCPPPPTCMPGVGTPGYWKNHPSEWPSDSITVGGVVYSKSQAISMMNNVSGDKWYTLFRAVVAAKLNIAIGNCSMEVCECLTAADAWLGGYTGTRILGSSCAWKCGEPLYMCLDAYNNGLLNVPARD